MEVSWSEVKLGDYVDLLSGFAFKSKQFTDNPSDIPLVKGANVHQGYIDWKNAVRWPKEEYENLEKFHLEAGDVVLAMDRPWIEAGLKYSWIKHNDPKSMLVQRVSRLRGINGLSSRYLRYVIGSPQFTNYIKPIVTGINVPHISGGQIKDYKFSLPPEKNQDVIANIIEPYDNLIENNNRRIAILEDMAQSLYKEWFVKFRFPEHQNTKFKESSLGLIPEEWEVKAFTEIAEVLGGGTPKTKESSYWNGDIPFFAPKDAPDSFYITTTEKHVTELGIEKSSTKLYPKDTVFITARGTVGKVVMPSIDMTMNQSCYALKTKNGMSQKFLFLMAKSQVAYLKKNTGGATFDTIVTDTFKGMKVVMPKLNLTRKFDHLVTVMFDQILNLINRNENLKKQRDMLLPKLISGKIRI